MDLRRFMDIIETAMSAPTGVPLMEAKVSDYMAMLSLPIRDKSGNVAKVVLPEVADLVKRTKQSLKKDDRIVWALRIFRSMIATELMTAPDEFEVDKQPHLSKYVLPMTKADQRILDFPMEFRGEAHYDARNSYGEFLGAVAHMIEDDEWSGGQFRNLVFQGTPAEVCSIFHKASAARAKKREANRRNLPQGDGAVVINFPDGWKIVDLKKAFCGNEGMAMNHCGNLKMSPHGTTLLSLRDPADANGTVRPFVTFVLNPGGVLAEIRGRFNKKPEAKFHPYIVALLRNKRVTTFMGNDDGGQNFELADLPEDVQAALYKEKPELFKHEGYNNPKSEPKPS